MTGIEVAVRAQGVPQSPTSSLHSPVPTNDDVDPLGINELEELKQKHKVELEKRDATIDELTAKAQELEADNATLEKANGALRDRLDSKIAQLKALLEAEKATRKHGTRGSKKRKIGDEGEN